MLYTGSYKNCLKGKKISISGDRGRSIGYKGDSFPVLAPKLSFWREWKENKEKISEEKNNYFYIKNYYEQVLKDLNPKDILDIFNNDTIFLCYEDNMEFCHRHIVAYWIELELGISVPEVEVDNFGTITIIDRPTWIKDVLGKVMEEDRKHQIKTLVKKIVSAFEGE